MMKIIGAKYLSTSISKPLSVLFLGSEEFAKNTLFSLLEHPKATSIISRLAVVAPPVAGIHTPSESMHELLKSKDLEKITFRKKFKPLMNLIQSQKEAPFDIGIVASFGKRIPDKMIDLFPLGMLVSHGSMLPKFRGPSPIQQSILQGSKEGGISVIEISKDEMDTGNILMQKECPISESDDYYSLSRKYGVLAGTALAEVLQDLSKFRSEAKKQDFSKVTPAPLIEKTNAILLWDQLTCEQAIRQFLALNRSEIPAFTKILLDKDWRYLHFNSLTMVNPNSEYYQKIISPIDSKALPGTLHWSVRGMKDKLCIKCLNGWVATDSLQLDSGRIMLSGKFIGNILQNNNYENNGGNFAFRMAVKSDVTKVITKIEVQFGGREYA